jgi:hypothetical protein
MTTTRPIRKMMPAVVPRNLSMQVSRKGLPEKIAGMGRAVCKEIGSREWDRTTDHLHVKEVLYH